MNNKGITLIEILVSLVIVSVLMAGFYNTFLVQHRTYTAQETITDMTQSARASVSKMVQELRMAGYKKPGEVLNGISVATPTTLRVLADLNRDADTTDSDEQVDYAYDSGTQEIVRTANNQAETLCGRVTSFNISYTLADGSVTSTPANPGNIRKVTVNFTVQSEKPITKTNEHSSISLTLDITPRNMGL